MSQIPTFTQFFDTLVAEKKQQIHKASDQDAFDAAEQHCINNFGFVPDSGFKSYKRRKNDPKKAQNTP